MNLLERKSFPLSCDNGQKFDVIIFGSGLAGLTAAYYASLENDSVALIYSSIKKSSSFKAKGGLAAPIAKGDSVKKHVNDTLKAGAGLCNKKTAEFIIKKSIPQIKELISLGMKFDEVNGKIDLGKEGGHSENRVLHIFGDRTGKGLTEFIASLVKEKGIHLIPETNLIDLNVNLNKCSSAVIYSNKKGFQAVKAKSFVIATGGYSSIYSNSTNSSEAKGTALSAAFRAGIVLSDLEFVQFHPTTLKGKESNYVVTESLRGEKALIINSDGKRFLKDYSPLAELATRDIISKAIYEQEFQGNKVFMDVRKLKKDFLMKRFPSFYEELLKNKLNPEKDLIPITPSAHYCVGGIKTDLNAKSSLSNVFSAGESSCSGLHGANRLACNSLLEAIVMGKVAGENASIASGKNCFSSIKCSKKIFKSKKSEKNHLTDLRKKMWCRASIMKSKKHLLNAKKFIELKAKEFEFTSEINSINYFSALQLSNLIVSSALKRKESRGVHQRIDYPYTRTKWLKHQEI
ncbi:MAG: FAD-binding protein [Candidatus Diapherotrites archaeon]|nr:FAD-binding protein [Candidatus Diapherotrites archaeon]